MSVNFSNVFAGKGSRAGHEHCQHFVDNPAAPVRGRGGRGVGGSWRGGGASHFFGRGQNVPVMHKSGLESVKSGVGGFEQAGENFPA